MNRLNQINNRLNAEHIDALLIFDDHNITYLSGFTGHAATALVLNEQAYLITDYRYFEQAKAQCTDFTVICRDRVNQSLAALIDELMINHAVASLAFEADHISHNAWLGMQKQWPDKICAAVSRWVEDLRYTKDSGEIAVSYTHLTLPTIYTV